MAPFLIVKEAKQFNDTYTNGSELQEYVQTLVYSPSQDGVE